ncbi:FAD-dependent oxidoreductase [Catellatospora sp. NPDC049609]|uniref:FAD-dependent oxidoreductase n=1 Tax=Catellatospora sp. NPDC049609 TaxID=3155505 RepID=UPI00341F50B4
MINGEDPSDAADVLVVGGGFAGLALAAELGARGVREVTVLEAGPDAGRAHVRWELDPATATAWWLAPETDRHFWRPYRGDGTSFTGIAGIRRRLGGRSLYWGGMMLPMDPWALDGRVWPEAVVADLTRGHDGEPPLFETVQARVAEWMKGPGAGSIADDHRLDLWGHDFRHAPRAVRHDDGSPRWKAYSPLETLPGNVRIVCDAPVVDLVVTDGAVVGVRVADGDRVRTISAGSVVLAASTIENSRLAIQALTGAGLLAEPVLPGLVDKVAQGFVATFDPDRLPAPLRQAAEQGMTYTARCDELRSNIFVNAGVNPFGVAVLDVYLMGEQTSGPWSRVRCEPDGAAPWPTRVECRLGGADQELVRAQQAELQRCWDELAAATGAGPSALSFDAEFGSPDLAERIMRAPAMRAAAAPFTYAFPLGSEQHEAGTLPLGGVLDENHEFRSLRGLYALGPCTFPRSGAANPVMTLLALAMRLGRHLST